MEYIKNYIQKSNIKVFTDEDIQEHDKIGSGGFSKVLKGKYLSLDIAIKKLKCIDEVEFIKEIHILQTFNHEYTPLLYGVYLNTKKEDQIGIVYELIKGESLEAIIHQSKIQIGFIQKIIHILDLCTVLHYFHSKNLIHRDLKPNNIMIDDKMNLRLLDFGISKMCDRSKTTTLMKGTILYMAPENFRLPKDYEVMKGDIVKPEITTNVDIWGLGCIISETFSSYRPWTPLAKSDNEIISNLMMNKQFPIPDNISNTQLRRIIELCVNNSLEMRPAIPFIKYYLLRILYEYIFSTGMMNVNKQLDYLDGNNSINSINLRVFNIGEDKDVSD